MIEQQKEKKEITDARMLWIDRKKQILSFQRMKGVERMSFPSREAMLLFAMEKGTSGYRIQ